ncbi:MAG: hypothetical protein ACYCWE_17265 [Eubacteriales bacterium]
MYCTRNDYNFIEEDINGGKKITVSSEGWTLRSERIKLYHDAADASVNWRYNTRMDIEYASDYKYIIGIVDSFNGGGGMDYDKLPETLKSMIAKKVFEELNIPEQISMSSYSYNIGKNQYLIFSENCRTAEIIAEHYNTVLNNWKPDNRIVIYSDRYTISIESNNSYIKNVDILDEIIQIGLRAKTINK